MNYFHYRDCNQFVFFSVNQPVIDKQTNQRTGWYFTYPRYFWLEKKETPENSTLFIQHSIFNERSDSVFDAEREALVTEKHWRKIDIADVIAGQIAFAAVPEVDPGSLFGYFAVDTVISFGAAFTVLDFN